MVTSLIGGVAAELRRVAVDVVDEPVLKSLLSGEPMVTVGVLEDLLQGVAGVVGIELGDLPLGVLEHLGVDGDLRGGTADATQRLMHEDLGMRQGVPLAGGTGSQQELAH